MSPEWLLSPDDMPSSEASYNMGTINALMDNQTTKADGIMDAATNATQWSSLLFLFPSLLVFWCVLGQITSPVRGYPGPFLASECSDPVAMCFQPSCWLTITKSTRTCGGLGTLLVAIFIWFIRSFTKSTGL